MDMSPTDQDHTDTSLPQLCSSGHNVLIKPYPEGAVQIKSPEQPLSGSLLLKPHMTNDETKPKLGGICSSLPETDESAKASLFDHSWSDSEPESRTECSGIPTIVSSASDPELLDLQDGENSRTEKKDKPHDGFSPRTSKQQSKEARDRKEICDKCQKCQQCGRVQPPLSQSDPASNTEKCDHGKLFEFVPPFNCVFCGNAGAKKSK